MTVLVIMKVSEFRHKCLHLLVAAENDLFFAECLPPFMAEVLDALEGMQLSQRFTGAAHQLQEDMDNLKLSLKSLDIGELLSSQQACQPSDASVYRLGDL